MQEAPSNNKSTRRLERVQAGLGAGACLVICAVLWQVIRVQQTMWPFPDMYLLEMVAVSGLVLLGIWSNKAGQSRLRGILTWMAIEISLGFVLLGVTSIGFAFIPAAGLLASAAILSDRKQAASLSAHVGVGLATAFSQIALMFAVLRIFLST